MTVAGPSAAAVVVVSVCVAQGRFKRPVDADGLCMGQEFVKAGNVPPWVGEVVLTAAAKVFSSSTQVDIYAKLPYFMNPVLACCQLVNVSHPGSEPQLIEAQEDMRLFAPALADKQGGCFGPARAVPVVYTVATCALRCAPDSVTALVVRSCVFSGAMFAAAAAAAAAPMRPSSCLQLAESRHSSGA